MAFYLTMGFFLKLNLYLIFKISFFETIDLINLTNSNIDTALIVSSVGFITILSVSLFFHYFRNKCKTKDILPQNLIHAAYLKYRCKILLSIGLAVILANVSNAYFGIYTKGGIRAHNFFIFNVYKYFISIGFAFLILHLLKLELYKKKKFPAMIGSLIFFENMFSSASQFSRVMILHSTAILFGFYKHSKIQNIYLTTKSLILLFLLILFLFFLTFQFSQFNREKIFMENTINKVNEVNESKPKEEIHPARIDAFYSLFLTRMVGIEGVLAVCSSDKLSWNFFVQSLKEKDIRGVSFYDKNIIKSPYTFNDFTKKQFITLPGFIAYFFYSGSYLILFYFIVIISLLCLFIEHFTYYITDRNFVIAAFVSQLTVYRLINFGYMPLNTIQYFLVILFTLILYFYLFKFINLALVKFKRD